MEYIFYGILFIGLLMILAGIQVAVWTWLERRYRHEKYKKYPWLNPYRTDLD